MSMLEALPPNLEPREAEHRLHIEDAMSSARRLWLRGRLLPAPAPKGQQAAWWQRWRAGQAVAPAAPCLRLETRVGGHVFEANPVVGSDGRFEALFTIDLPAAKRGWRMTRNRIDLDGEIVEKCGLALLPPPEARQAVVVLLPLSYTTPVDGADRMARTERGARLTQTLLALAQQSGSPRPFYYLGVVPTEGGQNVAEMALAATTLGWPAGAFLLLPGADDPAATFAQGLDRLRWVFAGSLELLVVNREPSAAGRVVVEEDADRSPVARFVDATDDPGSLVAGLPGHNPEPRLSRPTRGGLVPRYPVVFCHGLLAFSTIHMQVPEDTNCFAPLREFILPRGFRALFPQVPPTSSVADRAAELAAIIRRWTKEPVNLIAHSMGGLDARYMISRLGMADQVRSLTTIATPHRGTYLADWFIQNFRQRVPLLLAMEAFGLNVDGFADCRPVDCRRFNDLTPDAPGVRYFSYGGAVPASKVSPALRRGWNLLLPLEGPNDGLVSAQSAHWGEYLGVVAADHFAQTPDKVFVRPGEDFDALGFYTRLLEDLARRGF